MITVEQAISRIRAAGHDISDEYSDERCIEFLNNSLQRIAALLIQARFPALVEETTVHDGDTLPKNYVQAAGTYPLRMTAGKAEIVDGSEYVRFRYFATPALLEGMYSEFPYDHDGINEIVVRYAIMLALNENEYDIAQDSNLLNDLQAAIAGAMSM